MGQQEATLVEIRDAVTLLAHQLEEMGSRIEQMSTRGASPSDPCTAPVRVCPPPVIPLEPNLPHLSRYGGEPGLCGQFVHQCSLIFDQQPSAYSQDSSKVAFIMSLLTGKAASWAWAVSKARPEIQSSFSDFITEFRCVFHHPVKGKEAGRQLLDCVQGSQSVAEYSITFRILAIQSGFNDCALRSIFRRGLSSNLKDKLAVHDDSTNLEDLISLAIRLDHRINERRREHRLDHTQATPKTPSVSKRRTLYESPSPSNLECRSTPEPAQPGEEQRQLDCGHLLPEDRAWRSQTGACFYCGQLDHRISKCPSRPSHKAHRSGQIGKRTSDPPCYEFEF